jgi:hypothetical protein
MTEDVFPFDTSFNPALFHCFVAPDGKGQNLFHIGVEGAE